MAKNVIEIGLFIQKNLIEYFVFVVRGIGRGQLATEGFSDRSHVGVRLKEHETNMEHVKSMTIWILFVLVTMMTIFYGYECYLQFK